MAKETGKIPSSLLALLGGTAIAPISLWYGQNNHLMPDRASEQALIVDDFFNLTIAMATALLMALHNSGMILIFLCDRLSSPEGVYFHSRRDA
ncbi:MULTISPECIES: hypothetical protein [unclassified Microcoleus]|uniref:hypothetical protein n=1 Tax=unclassified Microcoleus TaxID=2642155 RepID=UPI002FD4ECA6